MKNSQIESLVKHINDITGGGTERYNGTSPDKQANEGHFYYAGAYGGSRVEVMSRDGGCSDALGTGYVTKKELYKNICSFIRGLSFFIDSKNYFRRLQARAMLGRHKAPHELPNYRAIKCVFIPPADHSGQKIRFYDEYVKQSDRVKYRTVELDNDPGEHLADYGYRILKRNGFNIMGKHSNKDSITFLCDNWGDEMVQVGDIK